MDAKTLARTAALAVATLLAAVGCGGFARSTNPPPPPARGSGTAGPVESRPPTGATPAAIRLVDEDVADLHLWVSNQSFEDDRVTVTVSIDGTRLVDQPFDVQGQHNWILFPVKLPPGSHEVTATSQTGAATHERFTVPEKGRRYAVLGYWSDPGRNDRHLSWLVRSRPVAFQ
ncbi:hypothetical protein OOJ91_15135 [Micromonospora lupini]|uniref:hypothetical protein n=1 Tax=Micromonospora lupini TaxID=285679 RepID=UPI00224DE68D|nr:hypothetical protein [Micromonospora lupini]MCX5067176.1 hypothetical protein [Micromonospora lupini]